LVIRWICDWLWPIFERWNGMKVKMNIKQSNGIQSCTQFYSECQSEVISLHIRVAKVKIGEWLQFLALNASWLHIAIPVDCSFISKKLMLDG
jgi:hypothetical protein